MKYNKILSQFRGACQTTGLALLGLSITLSSLSAQDNAAKNDVIQALTKLAQKGVSLSGAIEEEKLDDTGVGAGVPMIMPNPFSVEPKPYLGEVEIVTTKASEVAMVSILDVPGVKVYTNGDDKLCVQATTAEPFNTTTLASEISKLCNWSELVEAVKKATEIEVTKKGNITSVRAIIASDFFPSDTDVKVLNGGLVRIQMMGSSITPTVHELAVEFKLSDKKEITDIEYTVQYNDPVQAMFRGAGAAAIAVQGQQIQMEKLVPARRIDRADDVAAPVEAAPVEIEAQEARPAELPAAVPNAGKIVVRGVPVAPAQVAAAAAAPAIVPPAGGARIEALAPQVAGNVVVIGPGGGDANGAPALGKLVVYDFHVEATPSKRATAFIEDAKKMLKNSK